MDKKQLQEILFTIPTAGLGQGIERYFWREKYTPKAFANLLPSNKKAEATFLVVPALKILQPFKGCWHGPGFDEPLCGL